MPGRSAKKFLKQHPPFSLLDERALDELIGFLRMQVYPAGVHILRQGAPSCRTLHIVKDGTVRIYALSPAGQEQVLDFRSTGETFGFLSRDEGERIDASVQAMSDTVCYVADGAAALAFIDDHPVLQEYLLPAYFPKREAGVAGPAPAQYAPYEGSEKVLFTTPIEHLASREVLVIPAAASVLEAAQAMATHRVGALVVVDDVGRSVGIVTTSDLRDRVLVARKDLSTAVGEIMSAPLLTVESGDFCFEALLKMMSHDVHHLPVLDGERMVGIVSNHDFLVLQGTSPLLITREIDGQITVEGLAASALRIKGLVSLLLREGAGAGSILRVISTVNDRLEHRVLDLALKTLGPPPLPFCWIVYGSAGRREQTFKTDQDNAIVYADPEDEDMARAAEEYFGRFAEFVVDAFLRCGFALCQGDFMARNPHWRRPLATWKRRFSNWIEAPVDAALFNALNLFDFRGLHGDLRLAAELKNHLQHALRGQVLFLKAVADLTVDYRPPIGIFGSLHVERDGEHAHQLDIKKNCLIPLINIIRLFSLESGIAETVTIERLAALKAVHPVAMTAGEDLAHAFEFVSLLRIRHQHEQIALDIEPDNFIDPRRLSALELNNLKAICRLIEKILDEIKGRYNAGTRA
jgi:CBS domain-containing protein